MLSGEFLNWMHLLGMATYFGLQLALIHMLLPAANAIDDDAGRRKALIAGFRFYNPFSLGALLVLIMSGAIRLTDFKSTMNDFFARLGPTLELKLLFAFALIFVQTYLNFGLAFRITRQEEVAAHGDGEPFSVEKLDGMLRRIRTVGWVTIILAAATVLISI